MPFLNGTANNHKHLMNIMREFLEGYAVITLPVTYAGTGDGLIERVASPPPGVTEVWTLVCTLGGGAGVGTFSVTGSVSGLQANVCTVGQFYESDAGEVEFVVLDGAIDFVIADQFDITVTQSKFVVDSDEWTTNRWNPAIHDIESSSLDFPNRAIDGLGQATYTFKLGVTSAILNMPFEYAVEFDQYTLRARGTGFDTTEAPFTWTFQFSDDGINWTTADSQVANAFTTGGELKTFALGSPGRHLYWRLNIAVNNGGTDIEFSELTARRTGENLDSLSSEDLMMQGQGLAGGDEIHIGCKINQEILSPYFNWRLVGYTAFDSGNSFAGMAGSSPSPGKGVSSPRFVLDDGIMEYWLFGNGRYVACTVKIGTEYLNMYMGLFLPYGQPSEYSYPLIIAGSCGDNLHYTSTAFRLRHCFDPATLAVYIRLPGGTWEDFNHGSSSGPATSNRTFWPYMTHAVTWRSTYLDETSEGLDGTYELWPILPIESDDLDTPAIGARNMLGEIQDFFWISGSNLSAEDTITIGGDTYIAFQNVFRVTFQDYYAVRIDQ